MALIVVDGGQVAVAEAAGDRRDPQRPVDGVVADLTRQPHRLGPLRSHPGRAHPWRPTQFRVSGVYKRTAKVWVTDRRTGDRVRRAQARYDVRGRGDGRLYKDTFEKRG